MQETTASNGTLTNPESKPNRTIQFAILGLIVAAFLYAYFVQPAEGQGTDKGQKSVMRWLVGMWGDKSNANYSHGPLIPLISAALILRHSRRFRNLWENNAKFRALGIGICIIVGIGIAYDALPKPLRDLIKYQVLYKLGWDNYDLEAYTLFIPLFVALGFYLSEQSPFPSKLGLGFIGCAVLLYWAGIKSMQQQPVVISFVFMLYGLSQYLWGRVACKKLLFPVAFLFLMIPLNFLDHITIPLARLATFCAGNLCNGLGMDVAWRGTEIYSIPKGAFQFEIAEGCSGIRSLVALGMVTAVYAYLTEPVQWKRWAIFAASLPLAVLGNVARVSTILLVAQAFGQEVAGGLYHDYSSFIFFPVALVGMVVFAALLNLNYAVLWRRITQPLPASGADAAPRGSAAGPNPQSPPTSESPL